MKKDIRYNRDFDINEFIINGFKIIKINKHIIILTSVGYH